jgi:hypothetical protein
MAVTITHVFLWGSSATNHIENALMGSPWCTSNQHLTKNIYLFLSNPKPFFISKVYFERQLKKKKTTFTLIISCVKRAFRLSIIGDECRLIICFFLDLNL